MGVLLCACARVRWRGWFGEASLFNVSLGSLPQLPVTFVPEKNIDWLTTVALKVFFPGKGSIVLQKEIVFIEWKVSNHRFFFLFWPGRMFVVTLFRFSSPDLHPRTDDCHDTTSWSNSMVPIYDPDVKNKRPSISFRHISFLFPVA